jgi:hypothetical protein
MQQQVFLPWQPELRRAQQQPVLTKVQRKPAEVDDTLVKQRRSTVSGRNARVQFAERKRLRQVVVGAGFKSRNDMVLFAKRCQHHDRRPVRALAKLFCHDEAAPVRQSDIQHDRVESVLRCELLALPCRRCRRDRMTPVPQPAAQHIHHPQIVLDHKNTQRWSRIRGAWLGHA